MPFATYRAAGSKHRRTFGGRAHSQLACQNRGLRSDQLRAERFSLGVGADRGLGRRSPGWRSNAESRFACRVDRGTEGFETADLEHERAPLGFAAGVRRSASSLESLVDRTSGARGHPLPFRSDLSFFHRIQRAWAPGIGHAGRLFRSRHHAGILQPIVSF
jgi:hypothetical protein